MHVRIALAGAQALTDEHLFLLAGSGTDGAVVARDVETADGATDRAYLELVVEPGVYTIEAASGHRVDGAYEREDDFTLTIDAFPTAPTLPPAHCFRSLGTLGAEMIVASDGRWSRGDVCRSVHASGDRSRRHYARYFSLSLDEAMHVRIALAGAQALTDEHLFLLAGSGTDGAVVARDVETADGATDRAYLELVVEPGVYTIEAASGHRVDGAYEREDDFTLTINEMVVVLPGDCSEPFLSFCANPVLASALLVPEGAVRLIYDTALDETAIPSAGAFSVTVDGASQTVSGVAVAGRAVTLTLAPPVSSTAAVTVSYTVPEGEDAARIKDTGGDAAEGFADRSVEVPPGAPTITGVASTAGGLTVSWSAVTEASGYDLAWRRDGETLWQSTRTGQQQHAIGDLTDGALYWVRVRGAVTHGGLDGRTIYTTTWSTPHPGIASDWTPQNLQVTSGDRMLSVAWGDVPGATGYEVEFWPIGTPVERDPVVPMRDGDAWSAHIAGLDNGVAHIIRVRSVRALNPDATLAAQLGSPTGKRLGGGVGDPRCGLSCRRRRQPALRARRHDGVAHVVARICGWFGDGVRAEKDRRGDSEWPEYRGWCAVSEPRAFDAQWEFRAVWSVRGRWWSASDSGVYRGNSHPDRDE